MRVAFQGEAGAFSEQAALDHYGGADPVPCESFEAVFEAINSQKCDAGIIPVENSLAGSIHQNYDLLMQNDLFIVGEYVLRVRHCLIANPGAEKARIRKAVSHPQALGQCANYLRRNGIEPENGFDTAGSVKALKESGALDAAAIASRRAAEIYGMEILEEGIEDNPENYTRFLAIQREPVVSRGEAKTSIVFTLNNVPGALAAALNLFAEARVNLTKIESRPLQGKPWDYLFYCDFERAAQDPRAEKVLERLGALAPFLRVLGSYPRFQP